MQPQPHQVPPLLQPDPTTTTALGSAILIRQAAMHHAHVVYKPDVALLHTHAQLVPAADGVQRVEGLGLRLGQARDARGARARGVVADEGAAREVGDEAVGVEVEEGAVVVRGVAVEADGG